jgi:hypothetical protein
MFITALFTVAETQKKLMCSSTNVKTKCDLSIQWTFFLAVLEIKPKACACYQTPHHELLPGSWSFLRQGLTTTHLRLALNS